MKGLRLVCELCVLAPMLLTGCGTVNDVIPLETALKERSIHSIVISTDIGESLNTKTSKVVFAAVAKDLAERGYYVFPPLLSNDILGNALMLPVSRDTHTTAVDHFQADALFHVSVREITQRKWISSGKAWKLAYKMTDLKQGDVIWHADVAIAKPGKGRFSHGGSLEALPILFVAGLFHGISQLLEKDEKSVLAYKVVEKANDRLLFDEKQGLPPGPYFKNHK